MLRDTSSIPALGRSPGEGNDNPLQYSCLGNHMDRGTWRAIVHGFAKELDTTYQVNNNILLISMLLWLFKTFGHFIRRNRLGRQLKILSESPVTSDSNNGDNS